MTILKWVLAAILVFVGLALVPMRDLSVTITMPSSAPQLVHAAWLLPLVRVIGAFCLLLGLLLGWRTYRNRLSRSR